MKKLFKRLFEALKVIFIALGYGLGGIAGTVLFCVFFIGGLFVTGVITFFEKCLKSK